MEPLPPTPWPRVLPAALPWAEQEKPNPSGAGGCCSLSPTCPETVLGALRAADPYLRVAVKLKCRRHRHPCQPGTRSRWCDFSVPAWQSTDIQNWEAWRGQEQEIRLFEVGDLNQVVAKGPPRCFWCSGERRGNTIVQSQLEMPHKSLLRLQRWIASWERAVRMPYWIFQGAVFHWGWNRRENRVFQVTKNEQSNSFTGLWVAKKVYLIMGKRPEHSPGCQEGINPINKTKHRLKKQYWL